MPAVGVPEFLLCVWASGVWVCVVGACLWCVACVLHVCVYTWVARKHARTNTLVPRVCSGEAAVTQGGKEVNRLFKSDFFGERALLSNEPRGATVAAVQETVCLSLDRDTFLAILGPLDQVMQVRWVGLGRCKTSLLGPVHGSTC